MSALITREDVAVLEAVQPNIRVTQVSVNVAEAITSQQIRVTQMVLNVLATRGGSGGLPLLGIGS